MIVTVIISLTLSTAFAQPLGLLSCEWNPPHLPDDDGDGIENEDEFDEFDNDGDGQIDEDPLDPMCDWAACTDAGGTITCSPYTLKYYRSIDLQEGDPNVTRAIIAVHGRRDPKETIDDKPIDYYEAFYDAADDLGLLNETLIITPFFCPAYKCQVDGSGCIEDADDVYNRKCAHPDSHPNPLAYPDDRLCWSGSDVDDYTGGGNANNDDVLWTSAFYLLDDMVNTLAYLKDEGNFPNLQTIVVTGQSAGGQFVQRYAMTGTAAPEGINMRYVPCNPGGVTFLNALRPTVAAKEAFPNLGYEWDCDDDGIEEQFPAPGVTDRLADPEDWLNYPASYVIPSGPDYEWEDEEGAWIDCTSDGSYNRWPWGVTDVGSANDYLAANVTGPTDVHNRYFGRHVITLFGIDDNLYVSPRDREECGAPDGASEWKCAHALQGQTRAERGTLFFNHVYCGFDCAKHEFATVCRDDDMDGICDAYNSDFLPLPCTDSNWDGICELRQGHGRGIYRTDTARRAVFFGSVLPETQWAKTLGGTGWDMSVSIEMTREGGYVVVGNTQSYGSGGSDLWVTELDAVGALVRQKTYGGPEDEIAADSVAMPDGGYLVAGSSRSSGAGEKDVLVVKIDGTGAMEWQKTYGGTGNDSAAAIVSAADCSYLVAGNTDSFGAGESDIWLMKLDAEGDVLWQKTYGGVQNELVSSVHQTRDTGYILAGETYSFDKGNGDFWVLKVDAKGIIEWEYAYGLDAFVPPGSTNENVEASPHIAQTTDNGYLLAGQTAAIVEGKYMVWILKLDVDGAITWQKLFSAPGDCGASSIYPSDDGGCVISGWAGTYDLIDPNRDAWLMKLDRHGNIEWQNSYGGSFTSDDTLSQVKPAFDGGYVAVGGTTSFGMGNRDAMILKLDALGHIEDCSTLAGTGPYLTPGDTFVAGVASSATVSSTTITGSMGAVAGTDPEAFDRDICNPEPMVHLPRTGQTAIYRAGDDGTVQAGFPWPSPRFQDNGDGTLTDMLTGLMWLKDANSAGTIGHNPNGTGNGSMHWEPALDFVAGINDGTHDISSCASYTGEYTDWRVPNVNEIETLIHAGAEDPGDWLNGQGFVNVRSADYWSSTQWASYTDRNYAWVVSLGSGRISNERKSGFRFVWPVRAGQMNVPDPTYPANVPKTGQKSSRYPGDDGDLQRGVAWPTPRFTDHGNGTVTDNLTGLMWLKDIDCFGNRHWSNALDKIAQFNDDPTVLSCGEGEYSGDYTDWRMPNRRELHSLFDPSRVTYSLPAGHPFTDFGGPIWSSTTEGSSPLGNSAWGFYVNGTMTHFGKSIYYNVVWPVRGGIYGNPVHDADFNRDGDVDGADLARLEAAFGSHRDDVNFDERVNLVADDVIDQADLQAFARTWDKRIARVCNSV